MAKGEDHLAKIIAEEVAARAAAAAEAKAAAAAATSMEVDEVAKEGEGEAAAAAAAPDDDADPIGAAVAAVVRGEDHLAKAIAEEVAARAAADGETQKMIVDEEAKEKAADPDCILEDEIDDDDENDEDFQPASPKKTPPKRISRVKKVIKPEPGSEEAGATAAEGAEAAADGEAAAAAPKPTNYDPTSEIKMDVEKPMRPETKLEFERLLEEGRVTVEEKGGDHSKRIYRCNVCNKIFLAQYTLMRHMPVHTGERRFICPTCGKGFRQASTLCRHKAVHSTDRPFECKVCNKAFNRSSTLIAHMKTHQDDKGHKCPICGKGFHQKGNLKNHIYTHTGERPYACSLCEKRFNQMSNLSFHIASAHLNKSVHKCRLCPEEFRKKPQLMKHEQLIHGIEPPRRFANANRANRPMMGHAGTKEGLMKDVVQRRANFLHSSKEAKRRMREEGMLPNWHRPLNKRTTVNAAGQKTIVTNLPKNITHNKEGYKVVAAIMVGQNNAISVHKAVLDKTGRVVINKEKAKGKEEKELVKGLEVTNPQEAGAAPAEGAAEQPEASAMDIFKKMVGTQQLPTSIKMELPPEEDEEVVKMKKEAKRQREALLKKSPKKEPGTLVLQQGVLKLASLSKEEKDEMPSVELKLPPGQRMLKVPATISGLAVPEPERMYRVIIAGTGGAGQQQAAAPAAEPAAPAAAQQAEPAYMPQLGAPSAQPATMSKEDEKEVFKSEPSQNYESLSQEEELAEEPVGDLFGFENEEEEEPPVEEVDEEFWPDASLTNEGSPVKRVGARAGRMSTPLMETVNGTPGVLRRGAVAGNGNAGEAKRVRFSIGGDSNANAVKSEDDFEQDAAADSAEFSDVREELSVLQNMT